MEFEKIVRENPVLAAVKDEAELDVYKRQPLQIDQRLRIQDKTPQNRKQAQFDASPYDALFGGNNTVKPGIALQVIDHDLLAAQSFNQICVYDGKFAAILDPFHNPRDNTDISK